MKYMILTNHSYMLWQFRRELIQELLKQGEVVIGTPFVGHQQSLTDLGCRCIETEVDRRGINPWKDWKLFRTYQRLLKQERPDMVITYSIKPNVYGGSACKKLGISYCVNVQGLGTAFQREPMATVATMLYRYGLQRAATVFFENCANGEEFLRRGIVKKERIKILHGAGVNVERFSYHPFPDATHAVHMLFVGRIMKEKGVEEFFAAAQRVKQEYGERVKFHMVGFFEDTYKEQVERLEREGVIAFHGFQSDPMPYYQTAHCVVLPSYHEGMSNVLLEAAATGRAVITTDIPGCRETVVDGVSGLLCQCQSTESLYQAMKRFLELDAEQQLRMGRAGRAHVEGVFDKKKVVNTTMECLQV